MRSRTVPKRLRSRRKGGRQQNPLLSTSVVSVHLRLGGQHNPLDRVRVRLLVAGLNGRTSSEAPFYPRILPE